MRFLFLLSFLFFEIQTGLCGIIPVKKFLEVRGKIEFDKDPVENVAIEVENDDSTVNHKTNAKGEFILLLDANKKYAITFFKIDYSPVYVSIDTRVPYEDSLKQFIYKSDFELLKIDTALEKTHLVECIQYNPQKGKFVSVGLSPQLSAEFWKNRGLRRYKANEFSTSVDYLSRSILIDQFEIQALFHRGLVLYKMQEIKKACEDWKVAELNGDFESRKRFNQICADKSYLSFTDSLLSMEKAKALQKENENISMPQFPGGDEKLGEYLKSVRYPSKALLNGITGKVYVSFIIKGDGQIVDPVILRGIGSECDEEVLRVISQMPPWIPARLNGKPISMRFYLPVNFSR